MYRKTERLVQRVVVTHYQWNGMPMLQRANRSGGKAWHVLFLSVLIFAQGCAPKVSMHVLVHMMADQETFFQKEVIPPFEKEKNIAITVTRYGTVDSLESVMGTFKSSAGLVLMPFDRSRSHMNEETLLPLDEVLAPSELKRFKDQYLLTSLGMASGKQYLIPRTFETRIMVYSKSKVLDAVSSWWKFSNEIDSITALYNGYGLPATYALEENPDQWDYYDIFVVGWIWAHSLYDGKIKPRVAHHGSRTSGTSLRIVDRIFQLNGDSSSVMSMYGDPVVDAFFWEALYAASGIYNPDMWVEAWDSDDIWQAFSDSDVFLSFMTQLDCFFLHGTGQDNLNGYFKDPSDMGIAIMPQGCSFELDATGMPLRNGKRSISTGGWWWAIPRSSPDPSVSLAVASHVTSTTSQIKECTRFGMIPVRKEVLSDMMMLFGGGWVSEVYNVSFRQMMHNGHLSIPSSAQFGKISNGYLDMWYDIVVNRNWSSGSMIPSRTYISERIIEMHVSTGTSMPKN